MAYRDDVGALEARVAALSADIAVRLRERDEAARLLDEARARAHAAAYIADLEAGGPARRRRKKVRIAAMLAGVAMIVGGGILALRPHHDDRFETTMRTFEKYTDQMCACRDSACAMHVSDDMTHWAMTVQKEWQPTPKLDDAQMKRATAIGEHMAMCMTKAMAGPEPQSLAR